MEKAEISTYNYWSCYFSNGNHGYIYFSKPGRRMKRKNQQTITQVQTIQQKTDEKKENTEKKYIGDELENVTLGSEEYYGSEHFKEAYQQIHGLYKEQGLSESEIDKLVVLDVKIKDYNGNIQVKIIG